MQQAAGSPPRDGSAPAAGGFRSATFADASVVARVSPAGPSVAQQPKMRIGSKIAGPGAGAATAGSARPLSARAGSRPTSAKAAGRGSATPATASAPHAGAPSPYYPNPNAYPLDPVTAAGMAVAAAGHTAAASPGAIDMMQQAVLGLTPEQQQEQMALMAARRAGGRPGASPGGRPKSAPSHRWRMPGETPIPPSPPRSPPTHHHYQRSPRHASASPGRPATNTNDDDDAAAASSRSPDDKEAFFQRYKTKTHLEYVPDYRFSQPHSSGPQAPLPPKVFSFDDAHPALAGSHYLRTGEQELALKAEATRKVRRRTQCHSFYCLSIASCEVHFVLSVVC